MNNRQRATPLLLLMVALPLAAQTDSVTLRRVYSLNPVVVTGTGHHQRLRSAISPVEVIGQGSISSSSPRLFAESVVRQLPQLSISPNSTGAYLRLNGLSNKYALILLNGKRLIGDISGNVNLNRIDMTNVRRIEVLDGAASSLYGSDAIGGVVNIITLQEASKPLSFTTDTRVSAHGQFRQAANLQLGFRGFSSFTSFTHDQSGYYRNNPLTYKSGTDGDTYQSLAPLASGWRTNLVTQRFAYDNHKALSLFAEGSYNWHKTVRPETQTDVAGGFDYELRSEAWRWDAGATYRLSAKNSLQLRFNGDHYSYGNEYDVATKTYAVGDYVRKKTQRLYEGELKGVFSFLQGATTIAGIDWQNSFLDAISGSVDRHVYTWAGYLQHEQALTKNLKALLGMRYTYHETFGNNFTPKVALLYHYDHLQLRASYSRGYRAPGLDELYYHYYTFVRNFPTLTIGNSNLKAETSDYFSFNAEYQTRKWTAGITTFVNNIHDMIVKTIVSVDADEVASLRRDFPEITDAQSITLTHYNRYDNSDRGRVYGLRAHFTVEPLDGLSLFANYSYILARQQSDGIWSNVERSIRNTVTLGADYIHRWGRYTLGLHADGRLQSKTYYPAPYEDAPGYGLWNISTTHTFRFRGLEVMPSLGVDNVLNTRDRRIDSTLRRYANYSSGTTIVAGLRIKY